MFDQSIRLLIDGKYPSATAFFDPHSVKHETNLSWKFAKKSKITVVFWHLRTIKTQRQRTKLIIF